MLRGVFELLITILLLFIKFLFNVFFSIVSAFYKYIKNEKWTKKNIARHIIKIILLYFVVFYLLKPTLFPPTQAKYVDYSCTLPEEVYIEGRPPWENVRRWCDLIMQSAYKYDIEANLIAAIMWVESAGNPEAYSRDGATGLMQVMPKDGIAAKFMCPNGPCFADRPSMQELYNPSFNVDYGASILKANYDRLGNMRDALKSYGPAGWGYRYVEIVFDVYNKISQS